MTVVHNERTKLTATGINNIAVACIVAGSLSPIVAFAYGLNVPHQEVWKFALIEVAWISVGLTLHMIARAVRGRIKS
jgi:hypothetical protein